VIVEARAKLNLGLAVGPLRPDGYHEVATVFQSISLADTLVAARAPRGFSLRVRHESAAIRGAVAAATRRLVPAGGVNLVLRAARQMAAEAGLPGGARFTLVKRVPARAGLGGGSADAAAALRAMGALHGLRWPRERWLDLAARLGSDVPFAVLGGTALGLGRGERLESLAPPRRFRVLIAVPAWRVATRSAFRLIEQNKYGLTAWSAKLRSAQALRRGRVPPLRALRLGNTFEQALGNRRSDFESLRARMRAAGVEQVLMTGSGSAVFGILGTGIPVKEVVGRFAGSEVLFLARSTRAGLRLRTLP
jgi:4-diphosphocytidyl-2-C-methyl-D-erythritol kinase